MKKCSKFASLFAMLLIALGAVACKQEPEPTPVDTTAPANVTNLEVTAANGNAVLSWTNPTDEDFAGVKISVSPAEGTLENAVTLDKGVTTFSVSGLTIGKEYRFTIKTFDTSLNYSIGTRKYTTVRDTSDKTAPEEVTDLEVTAANGNAVLSWTNPTDKDFAGVKISVSPAEGTLENAVTLDKGVTTFSVSGLTIEKEYTFTIKTFDTSLNYSIGTRKSITVSDTSDKTAPANVTNLEVIAANGNAVLSWTNPTDEDFAGVKISVSPAEGTLENAVTLDKGVTTFSVSGLTIENDYTFTIKTFDTSLNYSVGTSKSTTVSDTSDKTAPAEVTNLRATAKNSSVLLTWTDPVDEDLFGIEITYTSGTNARSAINAMVEKSIFVAPKTKSATITNLTNGTSYIFTVKTMDTSGNKSSGVKSDSVSPKAVEVDGSEPLSIALTTSVPQENGYTGNKSNTTVTVTANITTANAVKKVVYKKDGSLSAKTLLADTEAKDATKDTSDDKKWTFEISATDETANGTYTVAAIDEAGREEAEQITIDQFDFTAPAKVNVTSGIYSRELSCIILNWTEPSNEDFDHVKITYTSSDDGTSNSKESEAITVSKGTANKTFTDIDSSKAYYTYYFVSVDAVGNESATLKYRVSVNPSAIKVPEGFVKVDGASFDGTETWTPSSSVFKSGRAITIRNLIVSDHEVTQGEYETYCKYGSSSPYESNGKGDNFPAYYVNWYDAIVYCNLRSIAENLDPVYKLGTESDPKNWNGIQENETEKYCGPSVDNSDWNSITMDIEADGYRLPTEAEWEYLARGGETTSTTYSGSDNIDEVAWYWDNSNYITHEVKGKKPNALGLYDMSGNVWEWCWDWYGYSSITSSTPETGAASGSGRCLRGGSWDDFASGCSVSNRSNGSPCYRDDYYGFRVVRSSSN